MKYSKDLIAYLDAETTAGARYLYYTPIDQDGLGSGEYVRHGLSTAAMDRQWHTFVRDLQADLADAQPGVTILEVNGFLIRGSDRVDNIKLRYQWMLFPAIIPWRHHTPTNGIATHSLT